ncbi:MAG: GumC family protein [Syntrophobacteraceae bacterium]
MTDQFEKRNNNPPLPFPRHEAQLTPKAIGPNVPEFDDSADIRDCLDLILRRKWLILTIISVVVFTTLVAGYAAKPLYRACGKIELSIQAPKVTKFEDMVMLGSQLQTREFMQTQLKLLRSESLAGRVIDKLQLGSNPAFNPLQGQPGSISGFFLSISQQVRVWLRWKDAEDPRIAEMRMRKSIESRFIKSLDVQPERDTTIFSLAFTSSTPAVARDVVNALIEEYISWQVDKRIEATITAKKRLEKQIELARIQLERAEDSLNDFSRKAGIVSLSSNLNLIYSQLEESNKSYAAAQAERIHKETLHRNSGHGSDSIPFGLESPLLQKLRADYSTLTGEYKDGITTFKDEYPKLQNIKAKMTDVEKQIRTEENRILESIKNDYLMAAKKEERLKQDSDAKKALALELNDKAVQYKILEREVETSKLIHQSLFERSREIDAKVGTDIGNIQVVDQATLPLDPYSPSIPRNLLIALLVGTICGFGATFLLEYLDNTIKRIDEISDRFQMSVLGVLPLVQPDELPDIGQLVRLRPAAGFSESTRTAKVSIQLSSSLDQPPKLLLICSTASGEGKSTIAANLAQAFASEEKVLLIDADLRRPSLHKIFSRNGCKVNHLNGLSNYLTGVSNNGDIVQETGIPNLLMINAGPIPPNPAELLSSSRMRRLLVEIYKYYDRIIIDGPPATGFADALILGHYVDGVVLVSTLGQTHRESLRIFRRNVNNVGGRVIGAIVNKLNMSSHYGGYYYKYYKYHRYYSYQPAYRHGSTPDLIANVTADKC